MDQRSLDFGRSSGVAATASAAGSAGMRTGLDSSDIKWKINYTTRASDNARTPGEMQRPSFLFRNNDAFWPFRFRQGKRPGPSL